MPDEAVELARSGAITPKGGGRRFIDTDAARPSFERSRSRAFSEPEEKGILWRMFSPSSPGRSYSSSFSRPLPKAVGKDELWMTPKELRKIEKEELKIEKMGIEAAKKHAKQAEKEQKAEQKRLNRRVK